VRQFEAVRDRRSSRHISWLACFDHNNPPARYALMGVWLKIRTAMYLGSFAGYRFAE
jgi:hypothetical protein